MKEEIQRLVLLTQASQERGTDEVDGANELDERSRGMALKTQLERLLVQVERALQRIEAGVYGLCERCGDLINPDRLQALPYATLCIGCARTHAA